MKTIGLLGGMSWESTATYYRLINQRIAARKGGLHSAQLLLHSYDFANIAAMQSTGQWSQAGAMLAQNARHLQNAGADVIAICTNTMHKVAPDVRAAIQIPLLHIADATAQALAKAEMKCAILLGTRFTMEQDFYHTILNQQGIQTRVPELEQRTLIHDVIFNELCQGKIHDRSRQQFIAIIDALAEQGADCVVLACTEIAMLINQQHTSLPVFDTCLLHAYALADYAIADDHPVGLQAGLL